MPASVRELAGATEGTAARWALFAVISAIFFLISGATFSSFGVILPSMIEELRWTWSQAGLGITLFAFMVGLASPVPAWILRRFGIKATYGIGGAVMATGFALLAVTDSFRDYLFASTLLGVGFASCATVPAVHLLNGWMPRNRSAAIGAYMTIGGLGAVAGPLVAHGTIAVTSSWRFYWWAVACTLAALAALALVFVRSAPVPMSAPEEPTRASPPQHARRVYVSAVDWSFGRAVRTPQYWTIAVAMTATLLCVLTANSWAVIHAGTFGVPRDVAAAVLSASGAVSALSRAVSGALATRVDPKWLLVAALASGSIGMLALAVGDDPVALAAFAIGEGVGFGMALVAATLLLVNYFGPAKNPEIYGTFNLITTTAMIGPMLAGFIAERTEGFTGVFQAYSLVLLAVLVITAAMRPPLPRRGST